MIGGLTGLSSETGLRGDSIVTSIDLEFVRTDGGEMDVLEIVFPSGVVMGPGEVLVGADWSHVPSWFTSYLEV